jgi:hypothetical protein
VFGFEMYAAAPLYHYTTATGAAGIAETGVINAPVYATNIPPSIMLNPVTGPIAQIMIGWGGPWQIGTNGFMYMPLTTYYLVPSATFYAYWIFEWYSKVPIPVIPK